MFGAWAPCTCTIVTCTCTCTMLHVLHGTLVVRYILFRECTPELGESIGSYILHVRTRPVGPADSVVMTLYLMEEQTLCGCYHWWAGCMVSAFVSHTAICPFWECVVEFVWFYHAFPFLSWYSNWVFCNLLESGDSFDVKGVSSLYANIRYIQSYAFAP